MRFLVAFFAITFAYGSTHADTLATVGSAKITREDFDRKMEELSKQTNTPPPPAALLEDLVRLELATQEAEKEKLLNDPAVRDQYKQIMYNALLDKELKREDDKIKVSESDMKAFYKKNPEVHIAHILVSLKPGSRTIDRELARKRAIEILEECKQAGKKFADVAGEETDDPTSKDSGGDIGFHSKLTLPPAMYDAAVKMKVGDVQGPIESPYGFHIIKLLEKRDYDLADKRQVRAALVEDKRTKMTDTYFAGLKKRYKVTVEKNALKESAQ